ncbi:hypothetical protein AVEN_125296-1 [Araneus ventricosus]|uniref:ATP-dependent DNA helicase n=1 Tax=Araneus ventricosus TaxID=182803 RepID=A0A4Y2EMT7_ARAVE|nr:hypothetical protein AVEN_125296-1 [Araneus ventricosus]
MIKKILLPEILNPPEILKDLLTSDSLESKNYRKHIREYNSDLAFASMGAQIKPPPGTGPYCYRIHGQIYHVVSPLYSNNNKPGYVPTYQRKCTESVRVGRHILDDRWVVPYNPWLSKKFNTHINVECASIKSVKYLYEYVYKGHDAVSIRFENENTLDHDEILSFLYGRYVSAPEAMWRLNEFNLSEKSHTVVRLAIHLPDQQAIVYQDGQEEEAVARAATRQTTLTAWFELNKNDQDSHNYLYTDIPHYYTFNKSVMKCQKLQRRGEQVIGRMPVVNIQDSETSTGIAETLLNGGRIAHSVFKIPIVLNATSTCNVKPNTQESKLICDTKLIIWDEAPMTHVHAFIAVDRLVQDLTNCSLPFGGKIIFLGGDFRQVLPVVLKGSRSLTVASCLKKHNLWSKFNKKNMGALETERRFPNWLMDIGEGKSGDNVMLPDICYPSEQNPVKQLYSDLNLSTIIPEELKGRDILAVTNDASIDINNQVLACLPGETVVHEAVDDIVSGDPNDRLTFPVEFLNSLTPTGIPPYKLNLKTGCIIMLLRNLAPIKGLCNGTRLIVTKLQRNIIEAKRIGSENGETYFIPQIPLIPSDSNMPFKFKRKQFPVLLAYRMTINKAQGQTFEKICLMMNNPTFSHGQLYVGFSRAKSFDSVTVVAPSGKIVNCVYQEVLND